MLSVNYNRSVLKSQINLIEVSSSVTKALERMSTGYKINRAKDNASDLYISSNLSTQIRGLKQAQNNLDNGIAYLNIGESSLNRMQSIMLRLRDLSVQASSDIYDRKARFAMQSESNSLTEELYRIQDTTKFNGMDIFSTPPLTQSVRGARVSVRSLSPTLDTVPDGYIGIYSAADLLNIENNLSANYILMNDIDLSGIDCVCLGQDVFSGIFDGNGYTISGLNSNFGLFYETSNATIKNVNIVDANIYGSYSAILAFYTYDTVIENCIVQGSVTADAAGGLVFFQSGGEIRNCSVDSTIIMTPAPYTDDTNKGCLGLLGGLSDTTVSDCYVKGSITYASDCSVMAAGFANTMGNNYITNCEAYVDIDVLSNVGYTMQAGFVMGEDLEESLTLDNCYYSSEISGTSDGAYDYITDSYVVFSGLTDNHALTPPPKGSSLGSGGSGSEGAGGGGSGSEEDVGSGNLSIHVGSNSEAATNSILVDTGFDIGSFSVDLSTVESAQLSLQIIDEKLSLINNKTAYFGAVQSRLESVRSMQTVQIENFTSSVSTIIDSDIAEESAEFVKSSILRQTTTALLSQAQNINNIITSLIF